MDKEVERSIWLLKLYVALLECEPAQLSDEDVALMLQLSKHSTVQMALGRSHVKQDASIV